MQLLLLQFGTGKNRNYSLETVAELLLSIGRHNLADGGHKNAITSRQQIRIRNATAPF